MGRIEDLVRGAIAEGVFPGACWSYGNSYRQVMGSSGRFTYCPESPQVDNGTIWDLASVSKVVGTTTAAMLLYDRGVLTLDMKVAEVLPGFADAGKADLRTRNLLVHDSGFIAFRPYQRTCTNADEVWAAICKEPLSYPTGTKMVYSDLNMIALQRVIETLSGQPLDVFLKQEIWDRLGMADTLYKPGIGNRRCSPTDSVEPWRVNLRKLRKEEQIASSEPLQFPDAANWIQGEVHDPNAAVCAGVAGHAGLFSTVVDLTRFAKFMLIEGEGLIKPETIKLFTKRQSELSTRAFGWDTRSEKGSSAGSKFGARSFGHTGYTGTSMWIDPDAAMYAVLLTNRVHPTSENARIIQFRPKFHDAVVEELPGRSG